MRFEEFVAWSRRSGVPVTVDTLLAAGSLDDAERGEFAEALEWTSREVTRMTRRELDVFVCQNQDVMDGIQRVLAVWDYRPWPFEPGVAVPPEVPVERWLEGALTGPRADSGGDQRDGQRERGDDLQQRDEAVRVGAAAEERPPAEQPRDPVE